MAAGFGVCAARVERLGSGLIHRTYVVHAEGGDRYVLQAVNPIFAPEVQEDIWAVTSHLAKKGMRTPQLLRSRSGNLAVEAGGDRYRLMTFVPGDSFDRARGPRDAREAAGMLARFHGALADLGWRFRARRLGVHDTARHLARLEAALLEHRGEHRLFDQVEPLAREILGAARELSPLGRLPERVVHGDPKISNVRFDHDTGEAICMLDLDTVGPMPVAIELGDALRSWCNPAAKGEDDPDPTFSAELFEAAIFGYRDHGAIEEAQWRPITAATMTIIVELSARFAADALDETYFGWDAERFSSRGEHNLVRARGQMGLARSLAAQRSTLEAIVEAAFLEGPR